MFVDVTDPFTIRSLIVPPTTYPNRPEYEAVLLTRRFEMVYPAPSNVPANLYVDVVPIGVHAKVARSISAVKIAEIVLLPLFTWHANQ